MAVGILARLAGALREPCPQLPDLVVGRPDRDHPVGQPARPLRVDRPGGRDVDLDPLLGSGVQARALEPEVFAAVPDDCPAEQLVDDLDRLEQHRAADADLRPLAADDMFVERLAGTEPEPEPTRVHRAERRGRMGDDRRVVAEARAGDRGPERERRPLAESAHEAPGERALTLVGRPRMEVLGDHEPGEKPAVSALAHRSSNSVGWNCSSIAA